MNNKEARTFALVLPFLFVSVLAEAKAEQAIEVHVEVAEIDHVKASRLGIEWLDQIQIAESAARDVLELGTLFRPTPLRADLNFLVQEGAAELLANPNLITDSGTTATFHAGGEIPYITASSLGTTNVEFKPFGVALEIQPKILKNGLVRMKVKAAVSAPDDSNGVVLSGNTVPALRERRVASNVTIHPGSTLTLAGLVQTTSEHVTRGVPVLRKVPILGALFRWKRENLRRTSVVMFVTPKLIEF